jgi:two-component system cell cycle response regulator DivK
MERAMASTPSETGRAVPLGKTVLIVEDDPTSMKYLSLVLRSAGYEVHQANYSLPALFRVARFAPDLILVDLEMPIMNGLDLIRQLKGHRDTEHIPIIMVTASDDPANRQAAFEAGCVGYVTKPVDTQELLSQVAEFVK